MTIQPIGAASAAIFCTLSDLSPYGYSPRELTSEQALRLVRDACRPSGLPLGRVRELEVYPQEEGVMIFAHLSPGYAARPPRGPFLRHGRVKRRGT